jgi:PKD repeat protein
LSGVDFVFSPQSPYLGTSVSFTAISQPALATQPITYEWDFDDGSVETGTEAVIQHVFALNKTYTVSLTAKNACTPLGVTTSKPVTVVLYQDYLPLVFNR